MCRMCRSRSAVPYRFHPVVMPHQCKTRIRMLRIRVCYAAEISVAVSAYDQVTCVARDALRGRFALRTPIRRVWYATAPQPARRQSAAAREAGRTFRAQLRPTSEQAIPARLGATQAPERVTRYDVDRCALSSLLSRRFDSMRESLAASSAPTPRNFCPFAEATALS